LAQQLLKLPLERIRGGKSLKGGLEFSGLRFNSLQNASSASS